MPEKRIKDEKITFSERTAEELGLPHGPDGWIGNASMARSVHPTEAGSHPADHCPLCDTRVRVGDIDGVLYFICPACGLGSDGKGFTIDGWDVSKPNTGKGA